MKSEYDGYVHTNGNIQVKRMPFGQSLIDTSSPFVKEYLGTVDAESATDAKNKLLDRYNKTMQESKERS